MNIGKDKEQNRMFLGLGVSRSVTLSRPRSARYAFFAFAFAIVIAIGFGIFFWNQSRAFGFLSKRISQDAILYVYIKSPNHALYYSKLKFWDKSFPNAQIDKLYTNFVQQIIGGIFAENDPASMISGNLEFAKLANGDVVALFGLRDKSAWFAFNGLSEPEYKGDLVEISSMPDSLLLSLDPESEKWFWYIEADRLFLVSNPKARDRVSQGASLSIDDVLNPFLRDAMALYAHDLGALSNMNNPYINFLEGSDEPITMYAQVKDNALVFRTSGAPLTSIGDDSDIQQNLTENPIKKLYSSSDFAIKAYFGDLSQSDYLMSSKTESLVDEMIGFSEQMYGINIQELDKKSLFSNFAIFFSPKKQEYFSENNWIAVSGALDLSLLEQFSLSRFAQEHPIRVENQLSDGTIMTELRAETEGLAWEDSDIDINGISYSFKSLRAQGEENGYYVGSIDGLGAVLANSETLLRQILENYLDSVQVEPDDSCETGNQPIALARFRSDFLFNGPILRSNIDFVDFFSFDNGETGVCVVLHK